MSADTETTEEDQEETIESALNAALHSEYWGWHVNRCVIYCQDPHISRLLRCPSCYKKAVVWAEPKDRGATPGERFAGWLGRMLAELWQGLTYPFRYDRDQLRAMLEDLLADGMRAEVVQVCPECERKG
jgi:hypothetical protein